MDKHRRYEVVVIVQELDKIISRLNDLADEEESAFNSRPAGLQSSVSGDDSKEAYEEIRSVADTISSGLEPLRAVGEGRASFKRN
jgi:hypothetical protein